MSKKRLSISLLTLCLASLVISCGGGGGGGGGSAKTGARVLHGAVDLHPVDAFSDEGGQETYAQTSYFAREAEYFGLSEGQHIVQIRRSAGGAGLFSVPLTVESGQRQTIVVIGTRDGNSITNALFNDDAGDVPDGMAAVRVINGIDGAGTVNASVGPAGETGIGFGGASAYLFVPAGAHTATITRAGSTLFSSTRAFESGKTYTLFAGGEAGYLVVLPQYEDR